jgi:hypothetical protein
MIKITLKRLEISPEEVLYARTTPIDYSMSRIIILDVNYNSNYKECDYIVLDGGHCSCDSNFFGHDSFEGTGYTGNEIKKLARTTWKNTHEGKFLLEYFAD